MLVRALAAAAAFAAASPALAQAPQTWQGPDQGGAPPRQPQAQGTCFPDLQSYCPDLNPPLLLGLCRLKDFDMRPECRSAQESPGDLLPAPQN